MDKFARLDAAGVVQEVCDAHALATHEPKLAATFVACPDEVVPLSTFIDGAWTIYTPPAAPVSPATLPLLTPMTLYMAFTPAERIAIKTSEDPMVKEFWDMYQLSVKLGTQTDPNLVSVREALAYLAAPANPGPGGGILGSPERVAQIMAGIPQ